ncbi:HD-GYP domain-containing protein [Bacillus sp. S3]|uniref:HD-GYP domain-containing protein n=1 Tax=Bacillus sp. S3 TaxID=486398 RepID=UPI001CC1F0CF|nr:HD domain-containing phosphohydrolase [Bacillus sp. S3]
MQVTETHRVVGKLFEHCSSTYRHSQRVGDLLYQFANYLKLKDTEQIFLLGIIHDIGKLNIPKSLLNKKGPLTQEEFNKIKLHTKYGQEIVKNIKGLPAEYSSIVRFHHENWDGSGYYGLQGINDGIPLLSRMIRIVDSYDAMIHGRIYQEGKTQYEAIREICSFSGKYYDPDLTIEFKDFLNKIYYLNHKTGS